MIGYSQLALASVVVGMADFMVEEFTGLLKTRAAKPRGRADDDAPHSRLAEAAAEAKAARLMIFEAAKSNMAKLADGEELDGHDKIMTRHSGAYAATLARRSCTRLFEAAGAHEIYLGGHMQRCFRDVYAATAHTGLGWDRVAVEYGRHQAGLPFPSLF